MPPRITPMIRKVEETSNAKWLKLEKLRYIDAEGRERVWERCSRRSQAEREGKVEKNNKISEKRDKADAVAVMALLVGGGIPPECLLVRQYRPPLSSFTIEFPAGLLDDGESAVEAAKRELKEETGYVGEVWDVHSSREDSSFSIGPPLAMSPGMTSETLQVITLKIDRELDDNRDPKQHLDDGEDIEVLRVSLKELPARLKTLANDAILFDGVYCTHAAHPHP